MSINIIDNDAMSLIEYDEWKEEEEKFKIDGFVLLIKEREYIRCNDTIVTIETTFTDIKKRMSQFKDGTKLLSVVYVSDVKHVGDMIIKKFSEEYKQSEIDPSKNNIFEHGTTSVFDVLDMFNTTIYS